MRIEGQKRGQRVQFRDFLSLSGESSTGGTYLFQAGGGCLIQHVTYHTASNKI